MSIFFNNRTGECPCNRENLAAQPSGLVTVSKTTSAPLVLCGDTVQMNLDIENRSVVPMQVEIVDALPSCAQYVPGSLCVDGQSCPFANVIQPLNLGVLAAGERVRLSYCLRICGAGEACAASIRYAPEGQRLCACAADRARSNFVQIGLSC